MHQHLADQMKTQSRIFVIGHVDLARHSHVPRRSIATTIPLAPHPRSWHSGAEAMLLMGGCHKNRQLVGLIIEMREKVKFEKYLRTLS